MSESRAESPLPDVATARSAEDERFLALLSETRVQLKAFIWSVLRHRELCEDVMQEVVLVLWKTFDRYDSSRPFGLWARGVAARVIMAADRRARRQVPLSPEAMVALLDAHERVTADLPSDHRALRACLDKLPERARRLVRMRYEEQLSFPQIAQKVGGTMDAVRMALTRVHTNLMRCLRRKQLEGGAA